MKRKILFLFTLFFISFLYANPVGKMLERLQKGLSSRFKIEIESGAEHKDYYELNGEGKQIRVKANNYISAIVGIHWYLKYYCHSNLSFCESRINIPDMLPLVNERKETPLTVNFYMNYCTFSYTTAFWDWSQWEQEIDRMALNGVTMPMAMVGTEAVWRNTLKKFGYTDNEIKDFLCGPAYFGWLLMGNLEQIGGPLPDEWFARQIALQKKIVARMREFGMTPVFQGFFGMVPHSLKDKYPDAHIIEQGTWNSLSRPPVLDPSDPLFSEMASVWYSEYEKLYGKAQIFGGDLFHEGGSTGGINITEAARNVQRAMLRYNPKAIWAIQGWGGNPNKELLNGMKKENSLVIDLCAEFWDNWKKSKGFNGFPWVWSHITDYGGNIGLHGRMDAIASGPIEARNDPNASACMQGVGATPEGIEINPVVFELANEMRWRDKRPDLTEWLKEYSVRRYGSESDNLKEAWIIFYHTAYGTYEEHRRPSESVFCALPSLKGKKITASAWSQSRIFYDPELYKRGVKLFLQSAEQLKDEATYQYDAVDFTRQYIADLGREAYYALVEAFEAKDKIKLEYWSSRFLQLLKDQDRLLSSHERFFVGRWLNMARASSKRPDIQALYEYNARLLIGTWTETRSSVRDYAHKEWGGMLKDYYLPRWTNYLAYLKDILSGKNITPPDSFPAEKAWIHSQHQYTLDTSANPVDIARQLFKKYEKDT